MLVKYLRHWLRIDHDLLAYQRALEDHRNRMDKNIRENITQMMNQILAHNLHEYDKHLRDGFASSALSNITFEDTEKAVETAYKIADLMLKFRKCQ